MEPPETGLVFHPDQYVHGVWFVPSDHTKPLKDRCDWLCCLWHELDEPDWYVRYRFRYPRSHDPWAEADHRSWMTFTRPGSESAAQIAESINLIAQVVALRFGMEVRFVPIAGDGDKALRILAAQPWMHFKEVRHE